ncbi:MAG TPA: helix-turn-helix domain-containing protein [Candidatus Handelsmanbacteria bacterium]|nr:helix-turn-helix domain-containing protein [Candidatus Handelsmanbacteria bacterium]
MIHCGLNFEVHLLRCVKKAGHRQVAIADLVGVHASTVSRELRRNKSPTGYYAQAA